MSVLTLLVLLPVLVLLLVLLGAGPHHGGGAAAQPATATVTASAAGAPLPPPPAPVPRALLGLNFGWEDLAYGAVADGELTADRSFRQNDPAFALGGGSGPAWTLLAEGGGGGGGSSTAGFVADSGSGECAPLAYALDGTAAQGFAGCAELNRSSSAAAGADLTAAFQLLRGGGRLVFAANSSGGSGSGSGGSSSLRLSAWFRAEPLSGSAGAGVTEAAVGAVVLDRQFRELTETLAVQVAANGTWVHVVADLAPTAAVLADGGGGAVGALLFIGLTTPGASLRLDEVRLLAAPSFALERHSLRPDVVAALASAGTGALRYPGGTLADFFVWQSAVGAAGARGEVWTGTFLETPSMGLAEFFALCELLQAEPLLQLNVAAPDAPDGACGDLVTYVQQRQAAAGGGAGDPGWPPQSPPLRYALLGNEPSASYETALAARQSRPVNLNNGAFAYATLAGECAASAQDATATALTYTAVVEANFLLADWFPVLATQPGLRYLYTWNQDVWVNDTSGFLTRFAANATARRGAPILADGHFYSPRGVTASLPDPRYWAGLAASGRWAADVVERVRSNYTTFHDINVTAFAPTEFASLTENSTSIIAPLLRDFQAGFASVEMLITWFVGQPDGEAYPIAALHDALQTLAFGIVRQDPVNATGTPWLRPAGLAMQLLSTLVGARLTPTALTSSSDSAAVGARAVPGAGFGILPTAQPYDGLSVYVDLSDVSGSGNSSGGGSITVLAINRRYGSADSIDVTLDLGAAASGSNLVAVNGTVTRYAAANLLADNEAGPDGVQLSTEAAPGTSPLSAVALGSLPPHSISVFRFNLQESNSNSTTTTGTGGANTTTTTGAAAPSPPPSSPSSASPTPPPPPSSISPASAAPAPSSGASLVALAIAAVAAHVNLE